MGESYKLIATPNKKELIVGIEIPVVNLVPSFVEAVEGKTVADFLSIVQTRADPTYAAYKFLSWSQSTTLGHVEAYFGSPKANDSNASIIPEPYRVDPGHFLYDWPTVLYGLDFSIDPLAPVVINSQERRRMFGRPIVKEGRRVMSETLTSYYTSNRPFPSSFFKLDTPEPTTVAWNFTGVSPNSLTCLHNEISFLFDEEELEMRSMRDSSHSYRSDRFFPATKQLDWSPFTLETEHQELFGLHLYRQTRVFPPGAQPSFT